MFVTLDGGLLVHIRPIRPTDKRRLAAGHRGLSEATIQQRYLQPKPRLSGADLRYLTEVDGHDHVALVAVPVLRPERIIGVARYVRDAEHPDIAEFAIVVADRYQGRGLGRRLAIALAAAARANGIRRFSATMLAENATVRRLLARIGQGLAEEHVTDGVREVVTDLAA